MADLTNTHIVLQPQDNATDLPRITAEVTTKDTHELELTAWLLSDPDPEEDEDPEYDNRTDSLRLSHAGWAQLVELFCLRYPAEAQRLVTKAQGWGGTRLQEGATIHAGLTAQASRLKEPS